MTTGIFGHTDNVNGSVFACFAIDHGCGGNANLWRNLIAAMIIARTLARAEDRNLPQLCSPISVKRIHAAVLGCDKDYVTRLPAECDAREVERHGVHLAVDREKADFAEVASDHARRR